MTNSTRVEAEAAWQEYKSFTLINGLIARTDSAIISYVLNAEKAAFVSGWKARGETRDLSSLSSSKSE